MSELADVSLATSGPGGYRPVEQAFYKLFSERLAAVGGRVQTFRPDSNTRSLTGFGDVVGQPDLGGATEPPAPVSPGSGDPEEPLLDAISPAVDFGQGLEVSGSPEVVVDSDRNPTIILSELPRFADTFPKFEPVRPSFRDKLVVFGISFYYVIYFYMLFHFFL